MMKSARIAAAFAVGTVVSVARAATVSVDEVCSGTPLDGIVTIAYTIGRAAGEMPDAASERLVFTATDRATGRTWTPRRFREVILPVTPGRHRVTWDANLDVAAEPGTAAVKADALVVEAALVSVPEEYLEIDVSAGPKAATYPVALRKGRPSDGYGAPKYKTDVIVLRRLPAGAFMAGSPDGEWGRQGFREHRHPVALTKPFCLSIYPMTRRQYANVMGGTCSDAEATLPMRQLSFAQVRGGNWPASPAVRAGSVIDVLRRKCQLPGLAADFDLPTESQWEYACRAGTDTAYNDGSIVKDEATARTVLAKLGAVAAKKPEPVGSFAPNAWGIFDMHGNVYDICRDRYAADVRGLGQRFDPVGASGGGSRVRRGGNFDSGLAYARSAARGDDPEGAAMPHNGFRLVCTAPEDANAKVLASGVSKPVAADLDLDSWLAAKFPSVGLVEDIVFADGDTVWIYDGTKPFTAPDAARWSWRARDDKALPPDYRSAMNGFGETKPMKGGRWIGVTGGFRWAIVDVATQTAVAWGMAPGSPHTLELLGDGILAVASTDCSHEVHLYDIAGEKSRQPNRQNRTAFRKLGDHVFNYPHGLHWDAASQKLWYAGSCGTNPRNEGELCKCSVRYENGRFAMSVDKIWKTKVGGVMLSDAHDLRPVPGTARLAVTTVEKLVYFDMKAEAWVEDDVLPYGPAKSFDPSADGRRFLVQIPTSSWIAYKLRLACYPTPGKSVWIDSFKSRPGLAMYKARWIPRLAASVCVSSPRVARDAFVLAKPGAVRPAGWLRDWAKTVRDGYTARMDEVDDEFKRAWREDFQPRGKKLHWSQGTWSCEGGAYWFDGLVKLAWQLDDEALKGQAKRRLDPLLDNMTDHPIGFCWWLDRREPSHFQEVYDSSDWMVNWVSGAMARPLAAWYAASGDVRAKRALEAALGDDYWNTKFKSQAVDCVPGSVISIPSGAWAAWRATKSEKILAALRTYAEEYARRPTRETYGPAPTNGLEKTLGLKRDEMFALKMPIRHGVVCQESLHSLFVSARLAGDAGLMASWRKWMDFLYGNAKLPVGTLVMDEEWGHPGPGRGVETCALAAESWGRINYLVALGEGRYGDDLERAFFNAAPASMTRDARAHVYFQTPNRLKAGTCERLSVRKAGENQVDYKEKTYPLCCTAGLNRLVPDFVQAMWMTTADGGVAATLYGPCTFETALAGGRFAVREETDYPFAETVTLRITAAPGASLPLALRVPGWCAKMSATVNGTSVPLAPKDGFARLDRVWKAGDTVTLRLPMAPRVDLFRDRDETQRDFACVSMGPLLFARGFAEKNANEAAETTAVPTVDPKSVAADAKVVRKTLARPFDWPLAAPVALATHDAAGVPLTLVPYGCTKLRAALLAAED